jgi:integrase
MTSGDDFGVDALAGFLPMAARDRLAGTLSEAEIDTLTHLAKTGTGPNSLRALASDLAYLEAWARASRTEPLVWPALETTVLRFIAHHLWDEEEREKNPEHGMPGEVAEVLRAEGRLKSTGPHAPATVRRRLALWSSLHRWRGLEGPFGIPSIRNALRLAIRAADRPRARKSASAITRDVLDQLLATCGRGRAVDLRDRALLLLAFGSGGRRRSEIARLKVDDLEEREPVAADSKAPKDEQLPVMAIRLRRSKTASADAGESVLVVGRPVEALRASGSPIRKSAPDRCFGGSTNGKTSAPTRSIRKASTP